MKKFSEWVMVLLFSGTLLVLMAATILLPKERYSYYENRNLRVLVLCPKKLSDNWMTYKANYVNNPIAGDRLRYDVLYHTDLSRTRGFSGELDLSKINWGAYDLVVIDESHNFRNGGDIDDDGKANRFSSGP